LREEVGEGKHEPWSEIISWTPRASLVHNFLTDDECDHLIRVAMPLMQKSTVVDSQTGGSRDSRVRTSSGMFLNRGQDRVISEIEDKIAKLTFIPKDHGEGIQVLHYEPGQKYDAHHDFFYDTVNTRNGGQRIATLLMYLTDVEEGGETVFPKSAKNSSSLPWHNQLSECGRRGVSVRPKRGDALLFWSMSPDAQLDHSSLHGGCPVIKGDKWSATKWMRVSEYKL
ncbi:hypothetical protein SELMODRAFT_82355, partial [Selaginella moellendorffii]